MNLTQNNHKIRKILAENLDFEQTMRRIFLSFPINLTLGLRPDKISNEECRFSLVFHRPMTNLYDVVQGGAIMACDSAIWMACAASLGHDKIGILKDEFLVTASLYCDFKIAVEPLKQCHIIAKSSGMIEKIKNKRVMSGYASILSGDGRELALLNATKVFNACPKDN